MQSTASFAMPRYCNVKELRSLYQHEYS